MAALFFTFINPELGYEKISIVEISAIHTAFNIANTAIMYPFSDILVKIAQRLTSRGEKSVDDNDMMQIGLDDRILETPGIAIQNCVKQIIHLGYMALENLKLSIECLLENDEEKAETVMAREKRIDTMQQVLTQYMIKICNADISEKQNKTITSLFHTVNDLERICDHCENLVELSGFMEDEQLNFSNTAQKEITEMGSFTVDCVLNAVKALEESDKNYAFDAIKDEAVVDDMEKELRSLHIKRLQKNECDATASVVFLDVLTNLERVSDHALNVAQGVISRIENKTIAQIKDEFSSKALNS